MIRLLPFLVCAALVATSLAARRPALTAAAGSLQQLVDAELSRFPAKAGLYLKHLKTGEEAAVRGDEV